MNAMRPKEKAEIEHLRKLVSEKPSGEMARLRLGFEGAEREVGCLIRQVEELKVEARENYFALPAPKLRQEGRRREKGIVVHTNRWVVGKGFCYFLNKFKESDLPRTRLGAYISVAIADGMRKGLEVGIMHGRKGTDINSIPAYDPNAAEVYANVLNVLNDIPFPLLDATATRSTSVEEIKTVESDFQVLAGIVPNTAAPVFLASAHDVSATVLLFLRLRIYMHGRKGNDINFIPAYDPNAAEVYADTLDALNDVPFPLLKQLETCVEEKFSYIKAFLVIGFIVAPSVPYAKDAGATATRSTPLEEIKTVELDFQVLAATVPDTAAHVSLASAPDVSAPGTLAPVVQEQSLFQ
ncbi:hypothetical protein Tco_0946018 [Tanacetum coccineum]